MKKRDMYILLSLLFLWFSVGCTIENVREAESNDPVNDDRPDSELVTSEATSAANPAVPPTPTEEPRTIRLTPAATPEVEILPMTAVPEIVGEVPEAIMTAVYEDLTTSAGLQKEAITVARAEATIWSDGSLGCPQPGQVYTQATVNGYWIVLEANGRAYNYHAAESGYFILCQNSLPQSPPAVGTPIS